MKHSSEHIEGTRRGAWLRNAAFACAFSGFAALSPLSEGTAFAQTPQVQETAQRTVQPTVRGQEAQLTDGSSTRQVRVVFRQGNLAPEVEVEGPARVNLRFYPVTSADWFNEQTTTHPRNIEYSVGAAGAEGTSQSFAGSTSASSFTSNSGQLVVQAPLGIGTPIDFTVSVQAGRQVISVRAPNGFLEVLGAEAVQEERRIVPDERRIPPVQPPPVPQPVQPAPTLRRPLVMIAGERTDLRSFGAARNSGDVYDLQGFGNIYLGDHWALSLGAGVSSVGLSMQSEGAQTGLRSISGRLLGGVSYFNNRHYLYALVAPGYRAGMTGIHAPDGRTADNLSHAFEFEGLLGYQYDRYFALDLRGGNAPLSPFTGSLYFALPYTYAGEDAYPDLSFRLRLLRNMRPRGDGNIGSFVVDESDLLMRWDLRLPIYRLGPIIPYAMLSPEYLHNLGSGGGNVFNFYLGPSLGIAFDRFRIDASAGWELVHRESAVPLVLLNVTAHAF